MRGLLLCAALMIAVAAAHAAEAPKPASVPAGPDRVYIDAVLDSMVEAGVITQDQADKLKLRGQQALDTAAAQKAAVPAAKKWYDTLKMSGYVQGRWQYYPDEMSVKDANGDKHNIQNEFMVRRARFSIEANPNPYTKILMQPDFGQNAVVMKDAWVERSFGPHMENRVRMGQQDVPFGFEVPQSSGAMLPLERNWVTRRTIPDEKDTGLVYYFTTPEDRTLFAEGKSNAWAPGDFGNIAVGFFNGQGMGPEAQEVDSNKHLAVRLTKPFVLNGNGAYGEVGASYFGGDYYSKGAKHSFTDNLLGFHGYIAPEPFGVQAEYFNGKTEGHDLSGWYATGLWKVTAEGTAFVRYDKMDGWRKGADADYSRHRYSLGYAHQLDNNTRITLEWDREIVDTAAGGSNDMIGLQLMGKF